MSIHERPTKLIIAMVYLLGSGHVDSRAQTENSISWGGALTEAEKGAIKIVVEQTKNLGELFDPKEESLLDLSPEVQIETGSDDTFSSIVAKLTGNYLFFRDSTDEQGFRVPDASFFHVMPISAGVEADRNFDNVASLLEVGYIPWYWNSSKITWYRKYTKAGVFLQGGYKFGVSDSTNDIGGAIDQSEELPDSWLLRLKAVAKITAPKIVVVTPVFEASGWYDIANFAFYGSVSAQLAISITDEYSFDLTYQLGSGAPTFNEGDQFSANLSVTF